MNFEVSPGSITEAPVDTIVVNLFKGVTSPGGATGAVDQALGGVISELLTAGDFTGKLGETILIYTHGRLPARKAIIVGLGEREKFTLDRVRQASAAAAREAHRRRAKSVATIAHGAGIAGLDPFRSAQAVAEGTFLGLYKFRDFKKKPDNTEDGQHQIERAILVEYDRNKIPEMSRGAARGRILAEATNYARDLVNRPGNYHTPSMLADEARALAADYGLEVDVLCDEDLRREGMGALLGVGRGSSEPPCLIVLKYHGRRANDNLALVGKGLTFDSGGISLKPSKDMHEMKYDMAGGAAVLGAMKAIAQLQPEVNVTGIIPAAENMPGPQAQKPGDVVTTLSGKTIEVINTDAEGRLVLADAVTYACRLGATRLVDVATLTGAVLVALGREIAAVLGNNADLISQVRRAGELAGERYWELPILEEYKDLYKSEVADLKNAAGREAGTIVGAMIIGEFAGETPWAHLDIAGVAWNNKDAGYNPKGGTGFGVRTLAELAAGL